VPNAIFKPNHTPKVSTLLILWLMRVKSLHAQGYTSADIFLDNNPTHKNKMKTDFYQKSDVPIAVRFHHFPRYSPLCNPTEYLIHLIRQKYLHHHDYKLNLQELEKILTDNLLGLYFYFQRATGQYFRTHQYSCFINLMGIDIPIKLRSR